MVGSTANPAVNSPKIVDPIPTITASTSTLTPEEMTSPSTRSAMKAVLLKKANGSRTKPASVTSLNSISVMKTCTAMMKKASTTITQASSSTRISARFENTAQRLENCPAASSPLAAIVPGFMNSSIVMAPPLAWRPSPAKLSNTMVASSAKLPMMKAKVPM